MHNEKPADMAQLHQWFEAWVDTNVHCTTMPDDEKPDSDAVDIAKACVSEAEREFSCTRSQLQELEEVGGDLDLFFDQKLRYDWARRMSLASD